jgi:methyl-accepting chemotaxis protein
VGTLIVGRRIDQSYLDEITRKLNLRVKVHLVSEDPALMALEGIPEDVASLTDNWEINVKNLGDDTLVGYTLMHDVNQKPALIWEMSIPLPKLDFAQRAINRMYMVLIIIGAVFLILSLLLLEFLVLHPVGKLGLGGDLSNRLKVEGSDELSRLALKINQMLQALSESLQREKELKKREKQLTQELMALRIEIDHSKKREQVEEITGTRYFQQLQERARAMRKRKSG